MSSFPSKKGGGGGGTPGIVDAFLELDRDGDGFLDVSDITAALRSGQGGESAGIDEAALKKLLSEASGKGEEEPKITLDDFKALMMGSLGGEEAVHEHGGGHRRADRRAIDRRDDRLREVDVRLERPAFRDSMSMSCSSH